MIVNTISNVSQFRDCYHRAGRDNQFSYDGLEILFDYLDQLSDDINEPMEMDVIAICCDYAEDTAEGIASDYDMDVDGLDDVEVLDAVIAMLEDNGAYVGSTDESIVYRQF